MPPLRADYLWNNYLETARSTKASWMIKTLLIPTVLWLILIMAGSFERALIIDASIALVSLVFYSIAIAVVYRTLKSKRKKSSSLRSALVLGQYNTILTFSTSVFCARISIEVLKVLDPATWLEGVYLGTYFLLLLISALLAPHTIPTEQAGKEADQKFASWLPRIAAIQSAGLGIGILWGTWAMHNSGEPWTPIFLTTLFLLLAYLLVGTSMIGIHRTWVLARTIDMR